MQNIFYSVPEDMDDSTYSLEIGDNYDIADEYDQRMIADLCAEDYWDNHDGWESHWPLIFTLHTKEDGEKIAQLVVEMEAQPSFSSMHDK